MSIYNIISIFISGFCSSTCLHAILKGETHDGIVLGALAICNLLCGILIN